jgi:hypothetical protein
MGQTNINVSEHVCSKCKRRHSIQSFPYPREVWWCSNCWREFRVKQNNERRLRRQADLIPFFFHRPRERGWSPRRPYRSKRVIVTMTARDQYQVQAEFGRLVADWTYRGFPLTPQKAASLKANAIFIVKYVRTGKAASWRGNYWKRWKQLTRLAQQRQLEEFKARPIGERHKLPEDTW